MRSVTRPGLSARGVGRVSNVMVEGRPRSPEGPGGGTARPRPVAPGSRDRNGPAQRAHGLDVWQEPFVTLRLPKLFNLRSDPFETADHEGMDYNR